MGAVSMRVSRASRLPADDDRESRWLVVAAGGADGLVARIAAAADRAPASADSAAARRPRARAAADAKTVVSGRGLRAAVGTDPERLACNGVTTSDTRTAMNAPIPTAPMNTGR